MISVEDVARGDARTLTSDSAGFYAAPNLLPGTYTIHVEAQGFETVNRKNVVVTAGSDLRVDIALQPGARTVNVTTALPIVNSTNAQTGGTLDNQLLSNLPINGRNFPWQSNYVPGVMVGVGEGTSNQGVNGTPLANGMWNYIFDGLYSQVFFTLQTNAGGTGEGGDTTLMPLDAIQEMNVVLNPKAEYGWAPGITHDIALKSGTNDVGATAYAYGRDTALDARNAFATAATPVAFEQFGGTLGGAIKKSKVFYFAAFEGERLSTTSNYVTSVPTTADIPGGNTTVSIPDAIAAMNAAEHPLNELSLNLAGCNANSPNITATSGAAVAQSCTQNEFGAPGLFANRQPNASQAAFAFPEYGGSNNGLFKLDYHVNNHHTVSGSLYLGRYSEYVVPTSSQNFTQPYYEELTAVASSLGRLVEIWTPNSNWLNQARVGVDHANRPVVRAECTNGSTGNPSGVGASTGGDGGPNYVTEYELLSGAPGCGIPTISINKFGGKLGFANNRVDWENPIQGADVVSYVRGTHLFKFGTDIRAENFEGAKVLDSESGTIAFGLPNFAAFAGATPLESFLAGQPSSETIRPTSNVRHITSNKIAFFAQDDWRIKSRLTLNLGLRWEGETPERDANGQLGNFAPGTPSGMIQNNQIFQFQSDWEPRLGFAYDLTGKSTTVIRGGAGVMYMIPQLMNFTSGGNGIDYGGEPTGAILHYADGTSIHGPGNITSGQITPTAIESGGVITGGLPWGAGTTLFPNLTPQCGNGLPSTSNPSAINPAPCSGQGGDPNLRLFPYWFWNLNVQHAFTNNLSLDVGYVGSRTYDLFQTYNVNQATPGVAGNASATVNGVVIPGELAREPWNSPANNSYGVVYPWFQTIYYLSNGGGSNYAGLQMHLAARNIDGLTLNANYTLSHALIQTPLYGFGETTNGNNPLDARQHFTLTATYAIPGIKSPWQILQGWAANASVNILSALSLALADTSDDLGGVGTASAATAELWNLYGKAAPFNHILGGAGTLTCYGIVGSKFSPASSPMSNGCIPVSPGIGNIGTPEFVSNLPAACQAGAAADSRSNGGLWNVANNSNVPVVMPPSLTGDNYGYNGYAQLALVGCYVANGSALTPPAQGTEGNMYASQLRGKGAGLLNASITKDWAVREKFSVQFRFEVFNVLNRTQYFDASTAMLNLGAPATAGQATSTPDVAHGNAVVGSGGAREMQLALRFTFPAGGGKP